MIDARRFDCCFTARTSHPPSHPPFPPITIWYARGTRTRRTGSYGTAANSGAGSSFGTPGRRDRPDLRTRPAVVAARSGTQSHVEPGGNELVCAGGRLIPRMWNRSPAVSPRHGGGTPTASPPRRRANVSGCAVHRVAQGDDARRNVDQSAGRSLARGEGSDAINRAPTFEPGALQRATKHDASHSPALARRYVQ